MGNDYISPVAGPVGRAPEKGSEIPFGFLQSHRGVEDYGRLVPRPPVDKPEVAAGAVLALQAGETGGP